MVLEGGASRPCSVVPSPAFAAPAAVLEGGSAPIYCAVWLLLLRFVASDATAPLRAAAAAFTVNVTAFPAAADAFVSAAGALFRLLQLPPLLSLLQDVLPFFVAAAAASSAVGASSVGVAADASSSADAAATSAANSAFQNAFN